jgi:hypothetical protein
MKKLLFVVIMIATWMVVIGCETTTGSGSGCYGFWEDNLRGLKRGTISWKNANYKRPYRQCVEKEAPHKNTERKPYG